MKPFCSKTKKTGEEWIRMQTVKCALFMPEEHTWVNFNGFIWQPVRYKSCVVSVWSFPVN